MRPEGRQRGFLLILAAVLIAVAAVMAVVIVTLTAGSGRAGGWHVRSTQALFAAESGLERATAYTLSPNLGQRLACTAIPATAQSVGGIAEYQLTTTQTGGAASTAPAPVLSNILPAATASPIAYLRVSSVNGLAAFGRIMLDRELLDYAGVGTSDSECGGGAGTSPCLRGVVRARDGTVAATHAAGTRIGHYQCSVTSLGGAPSIANPEGKRTLRASVQLQEGWAVGDNGVILRWDGVNWTLYQTTGTTLRAVSVDSYANGWAVGDLVDGKAQILQLNLDGTPSWDRNIYPDILGGRDRRLNAVHSLSANEAWAVGNDRGGGHDTMVMHWNGTDWAYVDPDGNFDRNLSGIFVLDTNNDGVADDGWAVGANGSIRRGMNWAAFASPTGNNLNAVFMVSAVNGWIVGQEDGAAPNNWLMLRWNGTAWSRFATTTGVSAKTLNALYCTDVNDCWAVGNRQGCTNPGPTILRWNGTAWSCQSGLPAAADVNLNAVACVTARDCWAVGDSGTILHWDGNTWTVHPQSGVVTTRNLRGLSLLGPRSYPQAAWQEIFP